MGEFFKGVETVSTPNTTEKNQEYIPKKSSMCSQESRDCMIDKESAEADHADFFGLNTPGVNSKNTPLFSPTVSPIGVKENLNALPQVNISKKESNPAEKNSRSGNINTGSITQSGGANQSIKIGN
ncbi:MAG: hypothetical protein PHU93_03580 [Candidatus Gracilibacteria bacterium]|nr:hypothetical protein [Candidatus Gracilibacteria bacterium]